jgi:hypothetical protein
VAGADSTVRVRIVGDAKSLQTASKDSEKAVGGIGKAAKIAGGAIVAAFAVDAVFDFAQSALSQADRVGDATTRLEEQLGDLSAPIIAAADEFADLGQSEGDILDLTARVADLGTAAGVADEKLGPMALEAAETAAALALLGDADADTIIDLIGKAAGGSEKPLKELGINLSDAEVEARALADTGKDSADALTDGELAAARFALVLEKLAPRVAEVTSGSGDLEQSQAELEARWETLTGKIGAALEGPLNDFLGWVLHGIDGLALLNDKFDALGNAAELVQIPLRAMGDTLAHIIGLAEDALALLGQVSGAAGSIYGASRIPRSPGGTSGPGAGGVVVQVQGGSPEAIEQAVRNAVHTITGRSGPLQ